MSDLEEKARKFWDVERSWSDGQIELVRLLYEVEQSAFAMACARLLNLDMPLGAVAAITELAKERAK